MRISVEDKAFELEEFFLTHMNREKEYDKTLACFFGAKVAHEVSDNCAPFSEEQVYWLDVFGILKRKMK